ncbi:hypothetical protein [Acetivibrio saccincola]|jgi:hypothetical protein|uniref:Uncharacterized protein n=1 Tax=Acetivibrio saccincola TaxID=1677857 RepID=A0A2K9E3W3_9FIRM|nr:hypothetical protein [Acetivibrio saccincola]AUG58412.1 hypothetical protein HVS_12695 [Acetivibrio saccincola]PQQ66381.1 hypothetical protein B9R14_06205 [Acetivibrio saccincola]
MKDSLKRILRFINYIVCISIIIFILFCIFGNILSAFAMKSLFNIDNDDVVSETVLYRFFKFSNHESIYETGENGNS